MRKTVFMGTIGRETIETEIVSSLRRLLLDFTPLAVASSLCRFFPSTRSTSTLQETLGGEILIEVRPVYSVPGSGNVPVRPLLGRGM